MNFSTANSTFRQLMGNGLSYRVPRFQRDYSWGEDEWDDLWQDIVGLFGEDAEPAHYMGYLVLQSADNKAFDIIDGQQRMTTLTLLALAAVSHLTDLADTDTADDPQSRRAEQLRSQYIGYLDPVSLVPRSKLTLNRHNDAYYQNYLAPLESLPRHGLNASERLLSRAFIWFKKRIRERAGSDGEAAARFLDSAVDKLFFTVITVTDELNAFKVFETLNARGVRLSATDLLKNYLFSVVARDGAHEREIEALENRWETVVGLLGGESFPEFLRAFWNSRNKLARKAELFKTIRREIGGKDEAFAQIRAMDRHARVYAALRRPEDDFWTARERVSLTQLQTFQVSQPMAVLLSVFDRFAEEDRAGFGRFLRAVAAVSFRYNVICGRGSNEQERIYNRIACEVAAGGIADAAGAVEALRPVYPSDEEFKAAFADKELRTGSSRNRNAARLILFRIETHLSGKSFDAASAKYGIEHVLPENPEDGWAQFDDRQKKAAVYRLGNMTLLEIAANRGAGNAPFSRKRAVYRGSEFAVTNGLAEHFEDWSAEAIRSRQSWLAKQAAAVWRIDF